MKIDSQVIPVTHEIAIAIADIERLNSIPQFRQRFRLAGGSEPVSEASERETRFELSEQSMMDLHTALLADSPGDVWHRGRYKLNPNPIAPAEGAASTIPTAQPFEVPRRMNDLVAELNEALSATEIHPLLSIGAFVGAFLAIRPFQEGNERLSRILASLLLKNAGYRYESDGPDGGGAESEADSYAKAMQSIATLLSPCPAWEPWLAHFLSVVRAQLADRKLRQAEAPEQGHDEPPATSLEERVLALVRGRRRQAIRELADRTGANRNTLKKLLQRLVLDGRLVQIGKGRAARYELP